MINRTGKCHFFPTIVLAALILFTGCDAYKMVKCPSYVVCYVNLDSIIFHIASSDSRCIMMDGGLMTIRTRQYGLHSTGTAKEKYDQMCIKHNDLSYNGYRTIFGSHDSESVTYNDCDFTNISITADRDFDAAHPKGTELSDIVRFMSWSPYKYILSGYSEYYHYDKSDVSDAFDTLMRIYINRECFDKATDGTCYPIDKLVKNLTPDDMTLFGGNNSFGFIGMLYFDKVPDVGGEYDISISINTDNDKVLSGNVKMQF